MKHFISLILNFLFFVAQTNADGRDDFQAALVHPANGKVYFFRSVFYHAYDSKKKELLEVNRMGKPSWKGVGVGVDAAMVDKKNNQAFFFKGNTYYRYDFGERRTVEKGVIGQDNFQGLSGPFDCAYWVEGGEVAYIFKNDNYYLWQQAAGRVINSGKIGEDIFKGVPIRSDAVIYYPNGFLTYFFKGDYVYTYDGIRRRVIRKTRIGKESWQNVYPDVDGALKSIYSSEWNSTGQSPDFVKGNKVYLSRDHWPKKKEKKLIDSFLITVPPPALKPPQVLKSFALGKEKYEGIPIDVDAVCHNEKADETYFFKNEKYYIYSRRLRKVTKTGSLATDFGVPDNLDAAYHQGSFIWFFKGDKYYKFWVRGKKVFKPGNISTYFNGIPENIDAVVLLAGQLRFYKKSLEFIYDINQQKTVKIDGLMRQYEIFP